jgi:hypothetical protein
MNHKKLLLICVVLLTTMLFARQPNAYAWDASTQITSDVESGHTVLIIQFGLPSYFGTPTPSHYPFEYQIRTTDGESEQYLEYPPIPIQQPTTAIFTVRYSFSAYIRYFFYVQARLHDNQNAWSTWGPSNVVDGVPVPEFPFTATFTLVITFLASVYLTTRTVSRKATAKTEKTGVP